MSADVASRLMLLLSCSARKVSGSEARPAIERYDGPSFRVLRKAIREGHCPDKLDILILSARYGLIDAYTPIKDYDQVMTEERAMKLQETVSTALDEYISRENYEEAFVSLGPSYTIAIQESILFKTSEVVRSHGRIGERLSQLKHWLKEKSTTGIYSQ